MWALALGAAALRTTNILAPRALDRGGMDRRRVAPHQRAVGPLVRLVRAARRVHHRDAHRAADAVRPAAPGGTEIFTIPQVDLPSWAAGVSLGGPVTPRVDRRRVRRRTAARDVAHRASAPPTASPARTGCCARCPRCSTSSASSSPSGSRSRRRQRSSAARVRDARRLRGRSYRGLRGSARAGGTGARRRARTLARARGVDGQPRLRPPRHDLARPPARRAGRDARRRRPARRSGSSAVLDSGAPVLARPPDARARRARVVAPASPRSKANATRSRYRPDPWRRPSG